MRSQEQALALGVVNRLVHEIATPLSVITFLIDEIKESNQEKSRQLFVHCDQLIKSVDHIRSVLHNQAEQLADDNSILREDLDFNDVVGDAIATMALAIRNADVALDYSFVPNLGKVFINRTQILQVFINLISNAMEAAAGQPERWMSINVANDGDHCEFWICNSGVKLTKEGANQILEKPTSTKLGHRGLGISISQKILQSHGGSLRFEEAPDGTCFVVRLPVTKA